MLPEVTREYVDQIVARYGRGPEALVPILQALQKQFRYLPDDALLRVCAISDITPAALDSVVSFFPLFRRTPAGEHTVQFDATRLTSGVYFYEIKTKDFRAMKKMVLVK